MKTKLKATTWNTYAITGYTHQVGDDPRATGGVHLQQVRRTRAGWQKRTVDSNGGFWSAGPATAITDADGAALFASAEAR